ncbi:MAG: hypothetical protein M1569_00115 [Candidatus Marsarchaeota archaeon]|nr:hypothetical protein [Candidatus Marsarchaeota archaeon]MCL5412800.1 hypothetical protein [Candidatus Marsarchaeota archaeon]
MSAPAHAKAQGPKSPVDILKAAIDEEKQKRSNYIHDSRSARNRLAYKLADKQAISQLSEISKSHTKNIGFLRKKKEQLEFRIATEAFTLEAEKDLIRKKNEVEREFGQALKSYRLRKKLEFIEGDIIELNKRIDEAEARIKVSGKRLDELYSNLRSLTGETKRKSKPGGKQQHREEHNKQEISFADIAIMKEKKDEKKEDTEFDESVLN